MTFEDRAIRRGKLRYDSDDASNKLVYQFTLGRGEKDSTAPSAATLTIYKPSSTTAVVSAQAATTIGTTVIEWVVDTTTTTDFPVDTGYRAEAVITHDGVVYDRQFYFDVSKYPISVNITKDRLIEMDARVSAMEHGDDESLARPINAAADHVFAEIEGKVTSDGKMTSQMILDASPVELAIRLKALEILFMSHDPEASDGYKDRYKEFMKSSVMTNIRYDLDGDGLEDDDIGDVVDARFFL